MKKRGLYILFALLLVSSVYGFDYKFYTINYECEERFCVEGSNISFFVEIDNRGSEKIELIGIEMRDYENNTLIGQWNTSYFPLIDYRGDLFDIWPSQKKTMIVNMTLPEKNIPSGLRYYPCFNNAVRTPRIVVEEKYNLRHCYIDRPEFVPMVDCIYNSACKSEEYCGANFCKKLKCDECEYINNHVCVEYECCDSDMCGKNQECTLNQCFDLDCSWNQKIENHICIDLNCNPNQLIIDNECVDANCKFDEYVFNYSCSKLNCKETEHIFNHTCKLLNCSYDEYLVNKTCQKLDCKFNQGYINNTCQNLDCQFYQNVINHACVNNRPLLIKMSIEMIILLLIGFLIYLDIKKYNIFRKNKLINQKKP